MKPILRKAQTAGAVSRERGRVLIITDKPKVPWVVDLESAGYEIVDVAAGTAALVSLRRSRPHLVIANTGSKGLSTVELVRMLNQTDEGVPLILFGGEPLTPKRREAALEVGAFDYFQLPGEFDSLILRVKDRKSVV